MRGKTTRIRKGPAALGFVQKMRNKTCRGSLYRRYSGADTGNDRSLSEHEFAS